MAIVQTLDKYSFIDAFEQSNRKDQFSREALEAIFDYLEEYSDSTGEPVELDIIAICCEWAEMSWDEIAINYNLDLAGCDDEDERKGEVEDYLIRHTQYVEVSDGVYVFISF